MNSPSEICIMVKILSYNWTPADTKELAEMVSAKRVRLGMTGGHWAWAAEQGIGIQMIGESREDRILKRMCEDEAFFQIGHHQKGIDFILYDGPVK